MVDNIISKGECLNANKDHEEHLDIDDNMLNKELNT